MAMTRTEAEVCRLLDSGYSKNRILRETAIAKCVVERVCGWSGLGDQRVAEQRIAEGSRLLLEAMGRERNAAR